MGLEAQGPAPIFAFETLTLVLLAGSEVPSEHTIFLMAPNSAHFHQNTVLRRDVSLGLKSDNRRFLSYPDSGCSDLSASTLRMPIDRIVSALRRVKVDVNRYYVTFFLFLYPVKPGKPPYSGFENLKIL